MKKTKKKPGGQRKPSVKKSKIKNDALRAFQLVCALIIVSICISFAVIIGYNNSKRNNAENSISDINKDNTVLEDAVQKESAASENTTAQNTTIEEKQPQSVRGEPAAVSQSPSSENTAAVSATANNRVVPPVTNTARTTEHKGNLVFVIDDAGNNLQELEPFLRIDGPLTIAVLPGLPNSREAARRIRAAGKEVILHQPMEAVGGQNPGPSAIYSNMSAREIRAVLEKNIEEVGPVAGMNNHQGSKITMDREIMEVILSFCIERGIYFLDSRTTAESVASAVSRRLEMKIAQRDTFLDNEQDKESMLRYLASGLARAQRNGTSVMIGHTHSPALAPLLQEQYPVLTIQGYTIKTVSDILK